MTTYTAVATATGEGRNGGHTVTPSKRASCNNPRSPCRPSLSTGLPVAASRPLMGKASAKFFAGPRVHHQIPRAGHNLPQETPKAFIDAILEVDRLS